MPAALAGPLGRVRSLWSTISAGQKVVIGLLVAGLVLGGFVFYRWITAPTMAPLFSNLSSADASAIVEQLNAEGTSYELADGGGTIMVPQDQVYDLRLTMSGQGLPAGDDTGYSLLDEQGITTSEFQQQVTYQRALEGELANTLEALDGVKSAVVHLAIPKEDVFATDESDPTASVLVDLKPGASLTGEQVQAVTNLVSSSVEGMSPEQVTVADSTGAVLSAAGEGVTSAAGDAKAQAEQTYEAQLAANAQQILDRIAGPGNAVVTVRADLNFDKTNTTAETYDYNAGTPAISESTTKENYTGTGAAVGGVLGAEDTAGTTGGGDSTYDKESTTSNNAVDKTVTTTEGAVGTVDRLTVSVAMDSATAGGVNVNTVQDLVGNAVGLDAARGDAITVASMAFDTTAADQAAADLKAAEDAEASARMWSMVKTGGIALGIALLVLVVWLRSRRNREEYEELEDEELDFEPLQVESIRDPSLDDRAAQLAAAQRERVRGEISEMVSERPDEVATMLRGWFADTK
jgi:flagellar M-ring protein FliF